MLVNKGGNYEDTEKTYSRELKGKIECHNLILGVKWDGRHWVWRRGKHQIKNWEDVGTLIEIGNIREKPSF